MSVMSTMTRRLQGSTTAGRPCFLPSPWVGYPRRDGERRVLPVRFEHADAVVETNVAVWRYASSTQSARRRLLMIHGFRGDHHGMQLIADALPEFEIFVPDLPGYGQTPPVRTARDHAAPVQTMAADSATMPLGDGERVEHTVEVYAGLVNALAGALDLGGEDVLVGHSFGTTVCAAHVAGHGRDWAGLALSAPISDDVFSGRLLPGAGVVELYYQISRVAPERLGNAWLRSSAFLEVMNLTMGVGGDPLLRAFVRDQHQQFFGSYWDRRTLLESYRASSRHTVRDYAADLDLPVILLPGAKDSLSTIRGRQQLRDLLPDGRLEILREAGHLIHYERPAPLARALRRFLASL